MTPESKDAIRRELAGYILGTAAEWMSLINLYVDPDTGAVTPDDHQYRTSWEFPTDDAAFVVVKRLDHTEVARFGVQITVDALPQDEPSWHAATFADLFPGDRVRIGQEESDVLKATRGQWHAKNRVWIDDAGRERDHQRPWEHEELRIDFSAYPGLRVYPPDTECEILCDAERTALLLLQRGFPGSTIVS